MSTYTAALNGQLIHFDLPQRAAEANQWIWANPGDTSQFELLFPDGRPDDHVLGSTARPML